MAAPKYGTLIARLDSLSDPIPELRHRLPRSKLSTLQHCDLSLVIQLLTLCKITANPNSLTSESL